MPHRLIQFHIEPGIDEPIPPDHHDHNHHHHHDLSSSIPTRSTITLTTKAAKNNGALCRRLAASDDPWHRDVIDPHDDHGKLLLCYQTLHRMLERKKQDMSTRRAMNQMAITLPPIVEDEDYNICHHFTELVDTDDVGADEPLPPKPTTTTTQPTNGLLPPVVVDSHPLVSPSTTKSKTMVLKSILRRGKQQRPSPPLLPSTEASSSSSLMRTRLMDEIHCYHNNSTILHQNARLDRRLRRRYPFDAAVVDDKGLRDGYYHLNVTHGMESNPNDPAIEEPKPPLEHIRRGMDPWEDLEDPHIVGHLPKAVGTTSKSSGLVVRKKDELGDAAADGTDSDNVTVDAEPNYTTHHEFVLLEPVIEDEAFRIYDEIEDDGTNDPTTVEPEPPHPHHMHRPHPRQLYHKEKEEDRMLRQQQQLKQLQHEEEQHKQEEPEGQPLVDRNRKGSPNSTPSPPHVTKSYEKAMNKKSRRKKKKLRKHTYGWK